MRTLGAILLGSAAGLVLIGGAQAADLPTKKGPPAPPPAKSCFASFYDYMNSTPNDCPLTYMGITVYGAIDVGAGYESHATRFNDAFPNGVSELVSKGSNGGRFQWVPNGLSQSNVGIKMKEEIAPGWALIGDVNTGFDPYSMQLANGPRSLVENNGLSGTAQSANGDSSRAGQWYETRAYAGIANKTFGTLTAGRQYAFSNDMSSNYDAMGGSYAFSLIGSSGTPVGGLGDTELARYNTSVKYQVAYNVFRAGALWQFGNYSQGNGSNGAYQFDLGLDYAGFSVDGIYSHADDAVFLGSLSAAQNLLHPGDLKATIANMDGGAIAGKYKNGPFQAFAGYAYARFSNPTDSYAADAKANGFTSIGDFTVPGAFVSITAYTHNKTLQTGWGGVKYAVRSDIDVAGAYYIEWQNNYSGGACPGSTKSTCAGNLHALSGMIDWRPVKRLDLYAGVMYSKVEGGMANGYTNTDNWAPTAGLRFQF